MVARPPLPDLAGIDAEVMPDAEAACRWLERRHQASSATLRGV
jgi:hypothetical protein